VLTDWIDVSVPVKNGMVHWPGDAPYEIERLKDFAKGDPLTLSYIKLGVHTGTHMDAPLHFVEGGSTIDSMPIEATVGPARVVAIRDRESVKVAELETLNLQPGERILFKTYNSEHCWNTDTFAEDFIYISHEGAEYLAARQVRTVGVDYLSVGGFRKDGLETHQALLGGGIWVIEGLNLQGIEPGNYELMCLPLKLANAEGAPARALVRKVEE
jgi:arylformamidase